MSHDVLAYDGAAPRSYSGAVVSLSHLADDGPARTYERQPSAGRYVRLDLMGITLALPVMAGDPPSPTAGGASAAKSDPVVERLTRALTAAQRSEAEDRDLYADALRLAIYARLSSVQRSGGSDGADPQHRPAASRHPGPGGLPMWRLKRTIAHIDANLGERVSLADMAAAAGLSRMHFAAQFRIATGARPHDFLLRRRIERAQQLLAETDSSIVEIALAVGFQTQAHFTTTFRRLVGSTPYQWRCANAAAA